MSSASTRTRGQARSRGLASFNHGLGVKVSRPKKSHQAAVTKTENILESLSISDSRPSDGGRRPPSRPHGSARPRPPRRDNAQSAGSGLPGVRLHMDRIASTPMGGMTTTSSSSLQSMVAESTSEDTSHAENNMLSMVSDHHVGPRRAEYVRGRRFILDLHAEAWIDPSVSGHPEARTNHGLEVDLMIAHDREVPHQLPRMRRAANDGATCWVMQVLEDDDDSSPRNFHKKLDIYSPEFPLGDSQWRASIRATWSFIQRNFPRRHEDIFNEQVISIQAHPAYSMLELIRIAQAIVHFEPVLDEMLRPGGDRKRNWADNPSLGGGRQRMSRAESIAQIERLATPAYVRPRPGHMNVHPSLLPGNPVNQLQNLMASHDWEDYRWTFSAESQYLSVCFARSVGEERAGNLVQWAGFVGSFLQAAVSCPSPALLQRSPANRLGLHQFLSA